MHASRWFPLISFPYHWICNDILLNRQSETNSATSLIWSCKLLRLFGSTSLSSFTLLSYEFHTYPSYCISRENNSKHIFLGMMTFPRPEPFFVSTFYRKNGRIGRYCWKVPRSCSWVPWPARTPQTSHSSFHCGINSTHTHTHNYKYIIIYRYDFVTDLKVIVWTYKLPSKSFASQ